MQEHYGGNFPKLRDIGTNYMETCKSYTRTLFREPGEKCYGGSALLRKDVTKGGEDPVLFINIVTAEESIIHV